MTFPDQNKMPFTRDGIAALNPNQRGCYGIFNAYGCVYIGQGDLRDRLMAHLSGTGGNPSILTRMPTYYLTAVPLTLLSDLGDMERRLIAAYRPECNRTAGG